MHRRLLLAIAVALASPVADMPGLEAQTAPAGAERLFTESPPVWFEEYGTAADISPDGSTAIYVYTGRILDLERGREAPVPVWAGFTPQGRRVTFGPHGELLRLGASAGKPGWYGMVGDHLTRFPIPPDASAVWTQDGGHVAYARFSAADSVFAGLPGSVRGYSVDGQVTCLAWFPGGRDLLVLALQPSGASMLTRLELSNGQVTVVARDLDAPTLYSSPIAVSPDGRHVYVSLASAGAPDPEVRNRPFAHRRLGIYAVDIANGTRRLVVAPPDGSELLAPHVAAGFLYWTSTKTDAAVVVVPAAGGAARLVMRAAQLPSWRPDGQEIGFAYGDWRWADWAINWDGGSVDVDSTGAPTAPLLPVITGNHEDFQPVWSPRGRWIAYHSHRSQRDVVSYTSPGHTDDIWLRRVGAPAEDPAEIPLTDFGWEAGSPDWSPDGTRLVFASYQRGRVAGVGLPFIVTVDTTTGRAIEHHRLTLPPEIHNVLWAAWSPVRDQIGLEADIGGGRNALWVVGADGSRARKVTEYAMETYGGINWMPDGRALVYAALTDGRMQLFSIPVTGTPRQLTHDPANLFSPAVSPDGRFIAATRVLHRKEIWRMPLPR